MVNFRNVRSLELLEKYSAKVFIFWLYSILQIKKIRIILLLCIWGGITCLSFLLQKNDSAFNSVLVKSIISIFMNNSVVFSMLFFGYEFYGITTLFVSIFNSVFIGSKVLPAFIFFLSIYPKLWIFVILEILPYFIGSYVGFSNGKVKQKKIIYLLCLLLLLFAAFFENKALLFINGKLNEIL